MQVANAVQSVRNHNRFSNDGVSNVARRMLEVKFVIHYHLFNYVAYKVRASMSVCSTVSTMEELAVINRVQKVHGPWCIITGLRTRFCARLSRLLHSYLFIVVSASFFISEIDCIIEHLCTAYFLFLFSSDCLVYSCTIFMLNKCYSAMMVMVFWCLMTM